LSRKHAGFGGHVRAHDDTGRVCDFDGAVGVLVSLPGPEE